MKLPRSIRFFRKPDHISFLIGLIFIIIAVFTNTFETKLISFIFFTFTIIYETCNFNNNIFFIFNFIINN